MMLKVYQEECVVMFSLPGHSPSLYIDYNEAEPVLELRTTRGRLWRRVGNIMRETQNNNNCKLQQQKQQYCVSLFYGGT